MTTKSPPSVKIISGGQTGADRAALDWAVAHKIPYGGWCPKGRLAEDGVIDSKYRLRETPSASYAERTEWNIRDADATVLFSMREQINGGSLLTVNLSRRNKKPFLHLTYGKDSVGGAKRLKAFLARRKIQVLNVSGPRASEEPQVGQFVQHILGQVLAGTANSVPVAPAAPATALKPAKAPPAKVQRRTAA